MIVFLNGASCSGKTSLVRALQARWPGLLLHWSLDHAISQMPIHYTGANAPTQEGFPLCEISATQGAYTRVDVGPLGKRLSAIGAGYVKNLADAGFDVVVDYVLVDSSLWRPFEPLRVQGDFVFAGIFCDEELLERRNEQRSDRAQKLAVAQQRSIHGPSIRSNYDIELDSSDRTADELSVDLIDYIRTRQGSPNNH